MRVCIRSLTGITAILDVPHDARVADLKPLLQSHQLAGCRLFFQVCSCTVQSAL